MKYLACVELSPSEFEQLAHLCKGDAQFPQTWAQWSALVADATDLAKAECLPTSKLLFNVDSFRSWCARVGDIR